MEIPTNDEGMFEAVDGDTVVGHGIVADGTVDFSYTDGSNEARVVMAVDAFVTVWGLQLAHLTLRAAT